MRMKNLAVLSILLAGLVVSGCTSPSETAPGGETASPAPTPIVTSEATAAPSGDIMDGEISNIESDMAELDALLADMDGVQNISFTELEGLSF